MKRDYIAVSKSASINTLTAMMLIKVALFILVFFAAGCMPASYDQKKEEMQNTAGECSEALDNDQSLIKDDHKNETEISTSSQLEPVTTEVLLNLWEPMRLIIPAIDLDYEVTSDRYSYNPEKVGNEPWNFSSEDYNSWIRELMALLSEGPVHYQFSALPGTQPGNVAIAGHSPSPWYHFYDLDRLNEGDKIFLETAGYRFVYRVKSYEIVDKYNWNPLLETDYPALTFQTCHPKDYQGYDPPERLMVRARLDEVYLLSE